MTITLTADLERTLTEQAEKQGTTPELLALHDLNELYTQKASASDRFAGKTLAEVLAGRTGTIRSSEHTGIAVSHLSEDEDSFGISLEEKRQQGHL